MLRVTRDGDIRPIIAFGNIVPAGLEIHGNRIYMGEAGPIPHLPENGRVVRFTPKSSATEVASGGSLIVDVEFGRGRQLYAVSQGIWDLPPTPENEGKPASPNTRRLLRVKHDGGLASVVEGLDRPTSLELIGNTRLRRHAYRGRSQTRSAHAATPVCTEQTTPAFVRQRARALDRRHVRLGTRCGHRLGAWFRAAHGQSGNAGPTIAVTSCCRIAMPASAPPRSRTCVTYPCSAMSSDHTGFPRDACSVDLDWRQRAIWIRAEPGPARSAADWPSY